MAGSSFKSFSGEGFLDWSKTMKRRLVSERLWCCVEKTKTTRVLDDVKALSLINQSLSPNVYMRIRSATTAKEAWEALHFMFLHADTNMDENEDEPSFGENVKSCEEDGVMLLSGDKPFFDMVLTKSALKPMCQMSFPSRVDSLLPSTNMVAKVRFFGKIYEIYFYGQRKPKSFGAGWRQVLDEHEMVEDDFLIFEIIESNNSKLEINMQILRAHIPPEMEQEMKKRGINIDQP